MNHFGELLKEARKYARLTQQALADKVDIDDSYISKMEKGGDKPPTREVAVKLAAALGISDKEERIEFLSAAGVVNAEDLKGFELVKIEDGENEEEEQFSIVHSAMAIPWKAIPDAPCGTTEEEMDEIVSLIASAGLSDEEEERINATLFEITKQLLTLIASQRKTRKEG
jgi:transcriptional regulator with XRE-family HTH domain